MGTEPQGTAVVQRTNTQLFYDLLQQPDVVEAMRVAVPRHVTPERLARIAYTTVRQTPALGECYPLSILMSVMEAAQLGLEPNAALGHAYLVPFDNKKTRRKEAQLMIGFKGKMELARRSKQVEWIKAEVVRDKDDFVYEIGLHPELKHKPYAGADEPGPLTHAYSVAKIKNVETPIFVVLTRREVEKRRKASRAASSDYSPWTQWEDAMWRKSAIHALSTYLPLSPEVQEAFSRDEYRDMGLMQGDSFVDGQVVESGAVQARPRTLADVGERMQAQNKESKHGQMLDEPHPSADHEGYAEEETRSREDEERPEEIQRSPVTGTQDDQGVMPWDEPKPAARGRKRQADIG